MSGHAPEWTYSGTLTGKVTTYSLAFAPGPPCTAFSPIRKGLGVGPKELAQMKLPKLFQMSCRGEATPSVPMDWTWCFSVKSTNQRVLLEMLGQCWGGRLVGVGLGVCVPGRCPVHAGEHSGWPCQVKILCRVRAQTGIALLKPFQTHPENQQCHIWVNTYAQIYIVWWEWEPYGETFPCVLGWLLI
jgi:hypothetical protein